MDEISQRGVSILDCFLCFVRKANRHKIIHIVIGLAFWCIGVCTIVLIVWHFKFRC